MSLQAELMDLEEDLDVLWEGDENDPERSKFSVDFKALRDERIRAPAVSKERLVEDRYEQQWEKMLAIREKLKEYSTLHSLSSFF